MANSLSKCFQIEGRDGDESDLYFFSEGMSSFYQKLIYLDIIEIAATRAYIVLQQLLLSILNNRKERNKDEETASNWI